MTEQQVQEIIKALAYGETAAGLQKAVTLGWIDVSSRTGGTT